MFSKGNKKCTVLRGKSKNTSAQIFGVTFLGLLASEMERGYLLLFSFDLSHLFLILESKFLVMS